MDRVPGERDPGADVEVFGFIQLGHGWPTRGACAGFLALFAAACAEDYSTLDPAGPAAAQAAELWWIMLAGAALILTGVMAAALYALKQRRRGHGVSERKLLIGGGLVFPVVVLAALMGYAFSSGETLSARADRDVPVFRAHARQWSWTFEHPGGRTAEGVLYIPAGTDFHLLLTSEDVIHSFWVPRLGGKMDAIPGRVNRIALRADRPGRYRGLCAEYCGIGHAHMPFVVVAHPPDGYDAELARAAGERETPVLEPRRSPAADAIRDSARRLLRWLGIRG